MISAEQSGSSSIAIIAVNYQTDSFAVRFIREVTSLTEGMLPKIALVDNSDRADSTELFDLVLSENPAVCCVKPPTNLGYFGGAWYGFEQCISTVHDFDWVMITNVDISFPDEGFFAKLRDMTPDEGTGVLAPSIRSSLTLHDQNPMMSEQPSRARMAFYRQLYRYYYLLNAYAFVALIYRQARYGLWQRLRGSMQTAVESWAGDPARTPSPVENHGMSIYAPHGACMVFSSEFFARGGSLEVPFFLYGEEIYVAESARALGLQVIYCPHLCVQHNEHQSTRPRGLFLSRQTARYLYETTNYLVDAYFSRRCPEETRLKQE